MGKENTNSNTNHNYIIGNNNINKEYETNFC